MNNRSKQPAGLRQQATEATNLTPRLSGIVPVSVTAPSPRAERGKGVRFVSAGMRTAAYPPYTRRASGMLRPYGSSRGQALLIAVLVLFAVATLGALFAAIIGAQLTQVARQSDLVALRNIAEAGLRLANEELTYSPLGADWRPTASPYLCGDGQVTIEVSYGPSPDRLQSRFLQVLSTAVFPDNPFLRHTILALKPVLLTDYARFITDRFDTNQPAVLGVTGLELGGGPRSGYIYAVEGPIRSNTDLTWYGRSLVGLHTTFDSATNWSQLGILRDDRVEVAGRMSAAYPSANDVLELRIDSAVGNGAENLFTPQTLTEQAAYARGFAHLTTENQLIPNTTAILADLPDYTTQTGDVLSPAFQVPRVRPPEVDAIHPDKQTNRYWQITRDSGFWWQAGNTGEHGWGWANYGGIYIDNGQYVDADGNAHAGDIQYNHDLEKLRLNWTRSVGVHQPLGDARVSGTPIPPAGPADWWDKTGRYYAPPGAEIILHGEAACPYVEIIRHDYRGQPGSGSYWRGIDNNGNITPIVSELEPPRNNTLVWPYVPLPSGCNPVAAGQALGIYDGNRAIFPFPPNGVIYAEGNVRVRGIMPPVRDNAGRSGTTIDAADAPQAYFGAWNATQGRARRFDLQVVSGGTIYIEGDLLNPSSARLGGLVPRGTVTDNTYYTNEELYSSRIAVLARDSVCVNTTALNPRPEDMFVPRVTQSATPEPRYYNDIEATYPPGVQSGGLWYGLFRGIHDENYSDAARAAVAALPTESASKTTVRIIYSNSRVTLWRAGVLPDIADLRLILGHSGIFFATPDPANGTLAARPDLTERVDVSVSVTNLGAVPQPYAWEGASPYQFVPAPDAANKSDQWYTLEPDNYLEFLPRAESGSYPTQSMPIVDYLQGLDDVLTFSANVIPVPNSDLDGWIVDPGQLGYILGPVAIAPRNRTETGAVVNPLPVEIDALIYAQNGSWFVIPGRWFDDDPDEFGQNLSQRQYPGYHEPLNIKISVYGAISESMPADLGSVADWTSKWCGPAGQNEGFLTYVYDPLLRYPRRETQARVGYLRFPNFPITSDLVIWGERLAGPAGS